MNPTLNSYPGGRREFLKTSLISGLSLAMGGKFPVVTPRIKIGIVGLSVHSADFTEIINGKPDGEDFNGCRVEVLYHPPGSEDVEFSPEQLSQFRNTVKMHGVEFAGSIEEVVDRVDALMLLTNDGRPHLDQALPMFRSKKPVYIDKPLGYNLSNVKDIFNASGKFGAPMFSCSALRYGAKIQKIRQGKEIGEVLGADAYSPSPLQPDHVDLFWDGIHGVETLFTVMGTGCRTVCRSSVEGTDVVVGTWEDGRLGVFRGIREGRGGFGGTVFGSEGITTVGAFEGYRPLVKTIAEFFRTKIPPVSKEETLEIYAFMEAADESKNLGGRPVNIDRSNF